MRWRLSRWLPVHLGLHCSELAFKIVESLLVRGEPRPSAVHQVGRYRGYTFDYPVLAIDEVLLKVAIDLIPRVLGNLGQKYICAVWKGHGNSLSIRKTALDIFSQSPSVLSAIGISGIASTVSFKARFFCNRSIHL